MNPEIATEAEKEAALQRIAELKQAKPGSAEEKTMLDLVSAVAKYVAGRRNAEVAR